MATAPFAAYAAYGGDAGTVTGLDSGQFQRVTDSVAWQDVTSVPSGLSDGDKDTTYTAGSGLALATRTFSADRTTLEGWARGVTYDSLAELRAQLDGVYAAKQTCTTDQVLMADAIGAWVCTDSTALPLSEAAVDLAVANNGYALATDLASLNTTVTGTTGSMSTLQGNVATINTNVTSAQASLITASTNAATVQGNLAALTAQAGSTGVEDYRYAQTAAPLNLAGTIPWDDTVPQITEGTELLAVSITPKKATNLLVVDGTVNWTEPANTGDYFVAALFRDAGVNAIASAVDGASNGNARCTADAVHSEVCTLPFRFTLVAGSTAATTLRLRVGLNGGNVYINQGVNSRKLGGALYSTLSITEIAQ